MYTQVTPIVQPQKKIMSFKTKDISFFCSDKDKKKKRRKSLKNLFYLLITVFVWCEKLTSNPVTPRQSLPSSSIHLARLASSSANTSFSGSASVA